MRVAIVPDHQRPNPQRQTIADSLQQAFSGESCQIDAADVVISPSRKAASAVTVPFGVPHVCYITASDIHSGDLSAETGHQLGVEPTPLSAAKTGSTGVVLAAHLGITHFLAGNGVAATWLRQELGRPVKVIYPAVDTQAFRPQKLRRSAHFLMVMDDADATALETAVAATRLVGRRLVVATKPWVEIPQAWREHSHVQFVTVADQPKLYQLLCECQALLCLRTADFDADVIRAQACGTPVLVSARGGLAELVLDAEQQGPGTGLFFDPSTPQAVASAMLELERRPHKCSAILATAHARAFSPARFEREIRSYLEAVVAASVPVAGVEPAADEHRRAA